MWLCLMLSHTGVKCSVIRYITLRAEILRVDAEDPQVVPQSACIILLRLLDLSFIYKNMLVKGGELSTFAGILSASKYIVACIYLELYRSFGVKLMYKCLFPYNK